MAYYPATPFPPQFLNPDTGILLSGGRLEAYRAGTSTPVNMYSDKAGTIAGSTVYLNAGGQPQVGGHVINIWLETGVEYKFLLKDPTGSTKWTANNITSWLSGMATFGSVALTFDSLEALKSFITPDGSIVDLAKLAELRASVTTKEYYDGTGYGGGSYIIKSLAQQRTDTGNDAWVPDGHGHHYVGGGTSYVAVLVIQDVVFATQFGAVADYWLANGAVNPTPTDNSSAIQAALDCREFIEVLLPTNHNRPRSGYAIEKPIYMRYGNRLGSMGDTDNSLIKTTNAVGEGGHQHYDGMFVDYAVDAAIIRTAPNGSSALDERVTGLRIMGVKQNAFGIYSAFLAKCNDADLTIEGFQVGMYCYDQYLCTYTNVWARNDGYQRGEYGFQFFKGTSCKMISCWAKTMKRGYEFGQLQYSWISSACDNFTHYAYNGGSSITYSGCGTEEAHLVDGGFVYGGGARQITISGGGILGSIDCDPSAGNASFFNFNGSQVTITGFRLPQLSDNCATRMDVFNLQGDAKVSFDGGVLPAETEFRDLVTHATQYSALKVGAGSGEMLYTKLQTPVFIGTHQYKHSTLRLGNDAVIGLPTDDQSKSLSAAGDMLLNVYYVSDVPSSVLTLANPSANYNVTIIIDAYILASTTSTYVKGMINHISGVGSGVTEITKHGSHSIASSWSGNTLRLAVSGAGAVQGIMEVRVKVMESNGGPRINWALPA